MSAADPWLRKRRRPSVIEAGTTSVEFSLLALVFFTFVLGIMEVARLLFVYNTLQEVTRRAAAAAVNVYPSDTAAIDKLKQQAVFRDSPGELVLATPVTDKSIRIDYLGYDLSVIPQGSWPSNAAINKMTCSANPHASNCIRFVRVQVCDPGETGSCIPVTTTTLIPLVAVPVRYHKATTIATAETLGYVQGTSPCPCP